MKHLAILLASVLALASCTFHEGTISVSGDAIVQTAPDTATLLITVQEEAPTTQAALQAVNRNIQTVLATLQSAGVEDSSIQTSTISFQPRQEWDETRRRLRVTGQVVTQSLVVSFDQLDTKPGILGTTLDALAPIDGIQIGGLSFGIKDTNAQYTQARSLAFAKARQKAEELASLAGLSLGKAQLIEEINPGSDPGLLQVNKAMAFESMAATPSEVPSGEIAISYTIRVVFKTR